MSFLFLPVGWSACSDLVLAFSDIMERSARLLCEGQEEGFSILNIGFGLGIVRL